MRLSVKRTLSIAGGTAGCLLVLLNIHIDTPRILYIDVQDILNLSSPEDNVETLELLEPVDLSIPSVENRPWFMRKGKLRPENCEIDEDGKRLMNLFPEEESGDRMLNQLMYVPPADELPDQEDSDAPLKKILLWNGGSAWGGTKPGRGLFLKMKCPVSTCVISTSRRDSGTADLIIFKDHFVMPGFDRPLNQLWMMYMLECPLNTQMFRHKEVFNWTATYRSDSTLVTPYERWGYYNPNVKSLIQPKNYAENKTKQVAWFVSNCAARNGRLEYAKELSKHIDVDIYGTCGTKTCPRFDENCLHLLDTTYKFYLAFENSNCVDYITEKFYVNGLSHDVLPIVMGARPEDYERSAPHKSFIHVDNFASPAALAEYLHVLDKDDTLYNEYFQWKGTGEMIDTKFFCRMCSLLHDKKDRDDSGFYSDINTWWRGEGTCVNGSWTAFAKAIAKAKLKKRNNSTIV